MTSRKYDDYAEETEESIVKLLFHYFSLTFTPNKMLSYTKSKIFNYYRDIL